MLEMGLNLKNLKLTVCSLGGLNRNETQIHLGQAY